MVKICQRCLTEPAYSFVDSIGRKYKRDVCKSCQAIITQEIKTSSRRTDKAREYHRNYRLKARFGITSEEYDQMLLEQDGVCYICKIPSHKTLHVDHNHATNSVRKLLCIHCNTALGHLRESEEIIMKMLEYIREHNASV